MASTDLSRFLASESGTQGGDTDLPVYITASPYFSELMAIWPDLYNQKIVVAPPGNGVDALTGRMLTGWKHVEQSIRIIFATNYHERILERWVGSFVPRLLGEEVVPRIITRHYWAMGTAVEHWEPRYKIKQILFMGDALTQPEGQGFNAAETIRVGQIFVRPLGVYYPRGHLGDFTPYERRAHGVVGKGGDMFDVGPSTPAIP